jgi:hypothetical protein
VSDPSDLEQTLRAALHSSTPEFEATPGARQALLGGMARHRARRQRALTGSVAALVVGVAAVVAVTVGHPSSNPSAPPHRLALEPVRPTETPTQLHAPTAAAPTPVCSTVTVSSAAPICAGLIAPIPTTSAASGAVPAAPPSATSSGSAGVPGSAASSPAASSPAASSATPTFGGTGQSAASTNGSVNAASAEIPVPLEVGQIFTVNLPAVSPAQWSNPLASPAAHAGRVQRLSSQLNEKTGARILRYKVMAKGPIVLGAQATTACAKGSPPSCRPTTSETWTLNIDARAR